MIKEAQEKCCGFMPFIKAFSINCRFFPDLVIIVIQICMQCNMNQCDNEFCLAQFNWVFQTFLFLYKICVHSFCRRKLYICYCHIPGSLGYLIFQDCLILTHLVLLLMDIKYELIQVLQTCHEASCQKIFLAEGSGLFFKNK